MQKPAAEKSCMPLVSVIIPAYNHERYIQAALSSLLEQTYSNLELLIIDDGSSDATWLKINEMKEACEKRFSRVVMYTRPNKGLCETYNELLASAWGEYIFFVNSDDSAKAHAVETLCTFLRDNPDYAVAVGDNEIIDGDGRVVAWDEAKNSICGTDASCFATFGAWLKYKYPYINFNSDDFGSYENLLRDNHIPNGYIIRKDIFQKTGLYTNAAPAEDWYIFLQIAKYGKIKYIDTILFSYRWHQANTIKNKNRNSKRIIDMTFLHEQRIVAECGNEIIYDTFHKYINRKRYILSCPPFFQFIK